MARDKKTRREPDKTAAEYYELKSGAVDELINANVTNTPEVSPKELNRYRRKSVRNMPEGLKYFLLKWWFAGVVCWFFMIGLGEYGFATLDIIVIMGVVTGLLWDLPVNIFIRMKAEKKDYGRYMMFPKTGVIAGILNVVYGLDLYAGEPGGLCDREYGNAVGGAGPVRDLYRRLGLDPAAVQKTGRRDAGRREKERVRHEEIRVGNACGK